MSALFQHIADERRRALLLGALSEFSRHGLDGSSTRAITTRAGVASGLLFYHFTDKETLFLDLFSECISEYVTQSRRLYRPSRDFIECIERVLEVKLSIFASESEAFQFVFDTISSPPRRLSERIDAIIAEKSSTHMGAFFSAVDDGLFKEGIDPALAKRAIMGAIEHESNALISLYRRGHLTAPEVLERGVETTTALLNHFRTVYYR